MFLLGLKPISDLEMETPQETGGKHGKGLVTVEAEWWVQWDLEYPLPISVSIESSYEIKEKQEMAKLSAGLRKPELSSRGFSISNITGATIGRFHIIVINGP